MLLKTKFAGAVYPKDLRLAEALDYTVRLIIERGYSYYNTAVCGNGKDRKRVIILAVEQVRIAALDRPNCRLLRLTSPIAAPWIFTPISE